ncbi:hypothetical protein R6Q59_017002 [Mikania micrantha]
MSVLLYVPDWISSHMEVRQPVFQSLSLRFVGLDMVHVMIHGSQLRSNGLKEDNFSLHREPWLDHLTYRQMEPKTTDGWLHYNYFSRYFDYV